MSGFGFGGFGDPELSGSTSDAKVEEVKKRYKVVDYEVARDNIELEDELFQVYRRNGVEQEYKLIGLYSKSDVEEFENTLADTLKADLEESSLTTNFLMAVFTDDSDEHGDAFKAQYLCVPFAGISFSQTPIMEEK